MKMNNEQEDCKYEDGETVIYYNPGNVWHLSEFKAYKSKYTANAFRLKGESMEVLADILELRKLDGSSVSKQSDQYVPIMSFDQLKLKLFNYNDTYPKHTTGF